MKRKKWTSPRRLARASGYALLISGAVAISEGCYSKYHPAEVAGAFVVALAISLVKAHAKYPVVVPAAAAFLGFALTSLGSGLVIVGATTNDPLSMMIGMGLGYEGRSVFRRPRQQ